MTAHKTGWTATGSFGTMKYEVNQQEDIVFMWDAPYDFNLYCNRMALAVVHKGQCFSLKSVNERLYSPGDGDRGVFLIRNLHNEIRAIFKSGELVKVQATMGNSHQCEAVVKVFPQIYNDLARDLKGKISKNDFKKLAL